MPPGMHRAYAPSNAPSMSTDGRTDGLTEMHASGEHKNYGLVTRARAEPGLTADDGGYGDPDDVTEADIYEADGGDTMHEPDPQP